MFGVPVQLNFSADSSTYNTKVGGFASIIVNMLMLAYFSMLVKRMVLSEADNISNSQESFRDAPPVNLNEAGVNMALFFTDKSGLTLSYD